jgi:hypothetical protein
MGMLNEFEEWKEELQEEAYDVYLELKENYPELWQQAENGSEEALEQLNSLKTESLLEKHHCHPGRAESIEIKQPTYNKTELRRLKSLSKYFAKLADSSEGVKHFRQVVLGGSKMDEAEATAMELAGITMPTDRILTKQEAYSLLESPAARYMSYKQFYEWKIPVVGHKVKEDIPGQDSGVWQSRTLVFEMGDTYCLRAEYPQVRMDGYRVTPGHERPRFPASSWQAPSTEEAVIAAMIRTGFRPGNKAESKEEQRIRERLFEDEAISPVSHSYPYDFEHTLTYPGPIKHSNLHSVLSVKVWPGSVLDELRSLGRGLAERYHWSEVWSVWFVLTGEEPCVMPLHAKTTTIGGDDFTDASIRLDVLPWVSFETVKTLYHDTQRALLDGDNRPFKNLDLFDFVTQYAGVHVSNSDWKNLYAKWKTSHRDTFGVPWKMEQAYNHVRERLLNRDYLGALNKANSKDK